MFDIRDKDGWTGVSAETFAEARFACETIADEGYELPLDIVPEGSDASIATYQEGEHGRYFATTSLTRKYEGRAA